MIHCTEKLFLQDVEYHDMLIIRDDFGAATGMECVVDHALIERRKEALRRRLAALDVYDGL